jgi:hypothetical protein
VQKLRSRRSVAAVKEIPSSAAREDISHSATAVDLAPCFQELVRTFVRLMTIWESISASHSTALTAQAFALVVAVVAIAEIVEVP